MTAQTELRMIAPSDLIIDTNVRHDPKADKSFVSSIKQHGVLSAITGQADDEGHVHVRMGQRRTLAAIEAGRDEVPVMVLPAEASADEAARIIEQLAENDHRAAISDNDRVAAVDALTGLGLSAAQIQRRTNRPKAEVAAAITVTESTAAREGVETATLTLEQGAVLAEFEDDPQAVDTLMEAAAEGRGFDHTAQRLRDNRRRTQLLDDAVEQIVAKGIPLADEVDYPKVKNVRALVNTDDGSDVRPEDHDTCRGHALWVRVVNTFDRDEPYRVETTTYCTDPAAYGHRDRFNSGNGGEKKKADEMSEDEREQAKAERREVIDNNKAWASAETVRREWVAQYLTRKTAPKEAAPFIALALAKGWSGAEVGHQGVEQMLTTLGVDASPDAVEKASNGRAQVLTLARVLAAYERQTDRNNWRYPSTSTRDYLTWIAAQGYDLSEVEQRATTTD